MLIGELARQSNCSRDTIRFYEKNGLLQLPKGRRGANNYKNYPESFVEDLKLIRTMTSLGFTLRETREFLESLGDIAPKACTLEQSLGTKIEAVEAQMQKLTALRESLIRTRSQCGTDCVVQGGKPGCA